MSDDKTNRSFSYEQLIEWQTNLSLHLPPPVRPNDAAKAFRPDSFATATGPQGMLLRLADRDGNWRDLNLNPALARELARAIVTAGYEGKWLAADGGISYPPATPGARKA